MPVPSRAEVASTVGKAAGRFSSAASTSPMRRASSASVHFVGLGEHDLVADRRLAERLEHLVVGVFEAVAGVDQHIDAGEIGAAAQVVVDQLGPGGDLGLGRGGIAVARHVDEVERAAAGKEVQLLRAARRARGARQRLCGR